MIKKLLTFCYWSDPAVFRKAEEGGFWVSFPDLPECMTQGDSMDEAYEMAVDALGLSLSSMEDEGTAFPKASELDAVDSEDGVLVIVVFDQPEQIQAFFLCDFMNLLFFFDSRKFNDHGT